MRLEWSGFHLKPNINLRLVRTNHNKKNLYHSKTLVKSEQTLAWSVWVILRFHLDIFSPRLLENSTNHLSTIRYLRKKFKLLYIRQGSLLISFFAWFNITDHSISFCEKFYQIFSIRFLIGSVILVYRSDHVNMFFHSWFQTCATWNEVLHRADDHLL